MPGFDPEDAKTIVSYRGEGCDICNKTGYKGRVALYEVMPIKDEIKELILQGASVFDIKKQAIAQRNEDAAAQRPAEGKGRA